MAGTCATCRYWDNVGGDANECRRYPPTRDAAVRQMWPVTFAEQGCGEYQADPPHMTDDGLEERIIRDIARGRQRRQEEVDRLSRVMNEALATPCGRHQCIESGTLSLGVQFKWLDTPSET